MKTLVCNCCNGTKKVQSIIEGIDYNCPDCGGHGFIPLSGDFWFYKPGNGRRPAQIALVQQIGDNWRVTKFDQRGPVTHWEDSNEKIMGEIDGFLKAQKTAPKMLDFWSGRKDWSDGIASMEILAIMNLFTFKGKSGIDLWAKLVEYDNTAERLAYARNAKMEHFPKEPIW